MTRRASRIVVPVLAALACATPARPDAEAPTGVRVPDGFTVELAAGPPLVRHPTMACFDDSGRLFVCDNAGVNMSAEELLRELPNSIRLLEDTDGDGRFDRATVFADRMTFPMGAAWHDGALYVASPPYIWRLRDTTGDGVADERTVLVGTFGFTGNAADIHGCFNGPDGRLYWCDGRHGHEFPTGKKAGSYIFSCLPDGSDVRIHCGGGMDNPVEVDFTDAGDMLGTVNILHSRPRVDAMVHWLYGSTYPHHERVLGEMKRTGDLLGPFHEFGHVAVSGTARYRSGALDPAFRDQWFVALFNSGKVVRLELEPHGSTYRATRREFLSGTGRDFHVTDVLEDADGSLLVIDTGGWFYRGCPTSQTAKPEILGGIYRVRREGVAPQADPRGRAIDWEHIDDSNLIDLFDDDRHAVRERAVAECAKRGATPALARAVAVANDRTRLNAVWSLARAMNARPTPEARAALRRALEDREAAVRSAACHAIANHPDPRSVERLMTMLEADVPPVRRRAAEALGRIGEPSAVQGLLAALDRAADRAEDHALIFALIEIDAAEELRAGLDAPSPAVRRGALVAQDQAGADLSAGTVAGLLGSDDAGLRAAALDVFRRRDGWTAEAATVLRRGLTPDGDAAVVAGLASAFLTDPGVAAQVGRALADPRWLGTMTAVIASKPGVATHPSWVGPLRRELASADPVRIRLALSAVGSVRADAFREDLTRVGADESLPPLLRVEALRQLGGRLDDHAFGLLAGQLGTGTSSAGAARLLADSPLTRDQLLALAPALETAGPTELRDLMRPFGRSSDPEVALAFVAAMGRSRGLFAVPAHELSDVIKGYPDGVRAGANALLDRVRAEDDRKLARLDGLLGLLGGADSGRGEAVFFSKKANCAACHRVGDRGDRIGPDLTTIGENRSAADLIESIVFPSASIVREYEPFVVTTLDGRTLTGMIARETDEAIELQQATGQPVTIPRDLIDELTPDVVSIMPKGLDEALTEQELADVVAYLMSLRGPRE